MKKYKVGITFGSFNPVHYGHIRLIQKIHEQCEDIFVCVDTDDYLVKVKGKELYHNYETRSSLVRMIKYVAIVFPQDDTKYANKEYYLREINKYKESNTDVALFVGDDHKGNNWEGETIAKKYNIPVVFLPHTVEIHSADIRKMVKPI
jgi:cytidyltransferase-like protein